MDMITVIVKSGELPSTLYAVYVYRVWVHVYLALTPRQERTHTRYNHIRFNRIFIQFLLVPRLDGSNLIEFRFLILQVYSSFLKILIEIKFHMQTTFIIFRRGSKMHQRFPLLGSGLIWWWMIPTTINGLRMGVCGTPLDHESNSQESRRQTNYAGIEGSVCWRQQRSLLIKADT